MSITKTGMSIGKTSSIRVTSIGQGDGDGRGGGGNLFGGTLLSGLTLLETGNGGSENVSTAGIDQLGLEGLDLNFNLFGDIFVLHRRRDGISSAMTISIRVGSSKVPSKSVGVTQSGEDCSRSLFIGKSHGDNRKTHQQGLHFYCLI